MALEKIDSFSMIKKNMHLSIRDGIQQALKELKALRSRLVQKIKEVRPQKNKEVVDKGSQTFLQLAPNSTPDTRKRLSEPTVSPASSAAKKLKEKRLKASKKEEEWVEVPVRKILQKEERKKPGDA